MRLWCSDYSVVAGWTDGDGKFSVEGLYAGSAWVQVWVSAYQHEWADASKDTAATSQECAIEAGAENFIEIRFPQHSQQAP